MTRDQRFKAIQAVLARLGVPLSVERSQAIDEILDVLAPREFESDIMPEAMDAT